VKAELASGPGKRLMNRGIREAARMIAYEPNGMPWAVRAGAFPAVAFWRGYARAKSWFTGGSSTVGP
jgi:hypothetical protein